MICVALTAWVVLSMVCIYMAESRGSKCWNKVLFYVFLSKIRKGGDLIVKTFLLCWKY